MTDEQAVVGRGIPRPRRTSLHRRRCPHKNGYQHIVTATDPHAAVRAVMDSDCPLQLVDWIEVGCRAWAVPWIGVTGFTWATDWKGDPVPSDEWFPVPMDARNLPGEPAGHWTHHWSSGWRFVPDSGTMLAGAERTS